MQTAVQAVERLLNQGAKLRATDIHCDPHATDIEIRFRIDGTMEGADMLPKQLHEEMIARLKILAGARTDVHAVPQDGRWKAELGGVPYNVRASFMPTYHGENAVLRLLPMRSAGNVSFAELGFTPDHVRTIDAAMQKTHGLILVTGPTGSGKTTTLMSCLTQKAREPLSIITLEDPIEYEVPAIRQIHIKHTHGVTFAAALRSCLRQDPDVIMVGEIRDAETARVAVHTALTGHLVLSTLHTNSAIEAIPRLMDMGVDHYLLASTLRLLVGQRLVRKICRQCVAEGCDDCRGSGYKGRTVLAEACEVDTGFRELVGKRASVTECSGYARSRGFQTIDEDGAEKVEWGVTTREEVLRVLYA